MKSITVSEKVIKQLLDWKELVKKTGTHQPFVTVKDVRKMGRRYLYQCPKQSRTVHLLSDGEFRAYQMLIWLPSTLEIREQIPLDLNHTLRIAATSGITHPRDWKSNTAYVMSTDFLVTALNAETKEKYQIAYTFKYFNTLYRRVDGEYKPYNMRTWKKLAIESAYWQERKIDYRIITEKDASKALSFNLSWFKTEHSTNASKHIQEEFCLNFIDSWRINNKLTIDEHLHIVMYKMNINFKFAQSLFKYVALHRILPLDLSAKLQLHKAVRLVM